MTLADCEKITAPDENVSFDWRSKLDEGNTVANPLSVRHDGYDRGNVVVANPMGEVKYDRKWPGASCDRRMRCENYQRYRQKAGGYAYEHRMGALRLTRTRSATAGESERGLE